MLRRNDKKMAVVFALLTIALIVLAMTNDNFFDWAYERHQNQMSWYIRPIFIIPFCFSVYRHSWAGISVTIFFLFTSMFWFNKPAAVSEEVKAFLEFEKDWLQGEWDFNKILLILSVPISFLVLGLAFWKKSVWMGLGVIILMATGKITWSIQNAGESGKSILVPAILGLIICCGLIFFGFKRLEKEAWTANVRTKFVAVEISKWG